MNAPAGATVSILEDEEAVRDVILPFAFGAGKVPVSRAGLSVTVHRRRDDGRLVVEYGLGRSARVFAKLYPDPAAGAAAFLVHDSLWRGGLGEGSPHRVPQPLAYVPEHGVLLLGPAFGKPLAPGSPVRPRDVRRAARWLACLHAVPVEHGVREYEAQGVLRLARRAAAAVSARPPLDGVVRHLLETLDERYARAGAHDERASTHGRFSLDHVFACRTHVTAVDLDRAALADPAKDVGELLHRLRWNAGRKRGCVPEHVDAACAAFVREYRRHSCFALTALEYHWSFSVVWTLLVLASKDRPGKGWEERASFLLTELDAIPRLAASYAP